MVQFFKRLFGQEKDQPPPLRQPATADEQRLEYSAQREARASMEAEVARDRAKRGIVDAPAPAPATKDE